MTEHAGSLLHTTPGSQKGSHSQEVFVTAVGRCCLLYKPTQKPRSNSEAKRARPHQKAPSSFKAYTWTKVRTWWSLPRPSIYHATTIGASDTEAQRQKQSGTDPPSPRRRCGRDSQQNFLPDTLTGGPLRDAGYRRSYNTDA